MRTVSANLVAVQTLSQVNGRLLRSGSAVSGRWVDISAAGALCWLCVCTLMPLTAAAAARAGFTAPAVIDLKLSGTSAQGIQLTQLGYRPIVSAANATHFKADLLEPTSR